MPQPRTLVEAWQEMRDIWQKQKIDPSYVFDTPLPSTANLVELEGLTRESSELESSIGELAPQGLQ